MTERQKVRNARNFLKNFQAQWLPGYGVPGRLVLKFEILLPVLQIRDILVRIRIQDANQKLVFNIFFAYYFLKVHSHHFSKIKRHKKSQNCRNHGFSNYFCLMIEGSGSVPLTNWSWSGTGKPQKHTYPDPYPQHWLLPLDLTRMFLHGRTFTIFHNLNYFQGAAEKSDPSSRLVQERINLRTW